MSNIPLPRRLVHNGRGSHALQKWHVLRAKRTHTLDVLVPGWCCVATDMKRCCVNERPPVPGVTVRRKSDGSLPHEKTFSVKNTQADITS